MSKTTRAEREAFAELDAIYAELPPIDCQGRCAVSCGGGILLTDLEARRLQLATHCKPRTTTEVGRCVYLSAADRCTVHPIRPLICRAWGVVKLLSCIHGCIPDNWLDYSTFLRIAVAVEQLGGGRILRTTREGLAWDPEASFSALAARAAVDGPIDEARVERDAERTLHLRALHGGRIIVARENDQ